ncbi:hypothetical protein FSP39_004776 [Pinctada imbricata]|uniref:Ileal sodium/bile acid cotransporter n=1 Tax=Pinctada imbricata TaxID=66713 RepID=A0AA88XYB7_PINIB|nr:hypothetical protein FSP39_004776 [Pinctada imbricata]
MLVVNILLAVLCLSQGFVRSSAWTLTAENGFDHKNSVLMVEDDTMTAVFNFTSSEIPLSIRVMSSDTEIFEIDGENVHHFTSNGNFSVSLKALFLGRAKLEFYANKSLDKTTKVDEWCKLNVAYDVVVKKNSEGEMLGKIFTGIVIVLVCVANVAMGCKTDLQVVKSTLKKPIAPITGLSSQFILMPLISFAVGRALNLSPAIAFGFFAMGASPGGAASNIYTFLLDGDVSLSVTMTFISTVASLGLIPLWLYTVGVKVIYKDIDIQIPFLNIITSLIGLLIPVGIGILIARKKPRWAKFILKLVRPITVIFVILVFTFGVYANLYVFKLMEPLTLLSGALIPYCSFAFGGLVALIASRFANWSDRRSKILTIAIETGIQNTGISIVLLQTSLPPPDGDIGIVAPIVCSIFTPIPMVIIILTYEIYKRCFRKEPLPSDNDFSPVVAESEKNGVAIVDSQSSSVQPLTWEKMSNSSESPKLGQDTNHTE